MEGILNHSTCPATVLQELQEVRKTEMFHEVQVTFSEQQAYFWWLEDNFGEVASDLETANTEKEVFLALKKAKDLVSQAQESTLLPLLSKVTRADIERAASDIKSIELRDQKRDVLVARLKTISAVAEKLYDEGYAKLKRAHARKALQTLANNEEIKNLLGSCAMNALFVNPTDSLLDAIVKASNDSYGIDDDELMKNELAFILS